MNQGDLLHLMFTPRPRSSMVMSTVLRPQWKEINPPVTPLGSTRSETLRFSVGIRVKCIAGFENVIHFNLQQAYNSRLCSQLQ